MTAALIDGKKTSEALRAKISASVASLKQAHGLVPGLAVVLVGEDPASQIYVGSKVKQTTAVGMRSFEHRLPAKTDATTLLSLVHRLNGDPAVHGILIQLPLPPQIDPTPILEAIDPAKDVDGFHPINVGRLWSGGLKGGGFSPCTPLGCLLLLRESFAARNLKLEGSHAVILGRSNIVGKPMAALLLAESCTITLAHSRSQDIVAQARSADILVAAVGKPGLVRGDWIKPGATVIDVGINRIPAPEKGSGATRLMGDVTYSEALAHAGAITPVPGGVGPMTIACLLRNTMVAACRIKEVEIPEGFA
ncbi:MAG: bifunctional methylenetetrahydrofolate dehydrogenase/methenyltetrahydrofolate cyclohydrolase FolD [Alphaproteobacteria bacterium]